MLKALFCGLLGLGLHLAALAQPPAPPEPGQGRIERIYRFESRYVQSRHIDVWLPADYSNSKAYAVLTCTTGRCSSMPARPGTSRPGMPTPR